MERQEGSRGSWAYQLFGRGASPHFSVQKKIYKEEAVKCCKRLMPFLHCHGWVTGPPTSTYIFQCYMKCDGRYFNRVFSPFLVCGFVLVSQISGVWLQKALSEEIRIKVRLLSSWEE